MELISKDTAIRVVDSGRNRQQLVDMMRAVPPVNAIEIPEEATNGDMIKSMVALESIATDGTYVYLDVKTGKKTASATFEMNWWDAPFKESEEKNNGRNV